MKIEFCSKESISDVMKFIDISWSKNHILSTDRCLMDYQHYNTSLTRYNYVIGFDNNMNIEGILGFIPTSKYSLHKKSSLWLSLWKTIPNCSPQLGLKLLTYLEKNIEHDFIGTLGISTEANNIYRFLKYKIGIMEHYYIANPKVSKYTICSNPILSNIKEDDKFQLLELREKKLLELDITHHFVPFKNVDYLINKYINHPVYNYKILYIETLNLILITRVIKINNTYILRIVDGMGELNNIQYSSKYLINYIKENNYEYVDFINYGLNREDLENNGFIKLDLNISETVIPMYFEPFLKENKVIRYAYKTTEERVVLFKADADQDRPNIVKENT